MTVRLPTLNEFLAWEWPLVSYLNEPGFTHLYVRKVSISVWVNEKHFRYKRVITIVNVETRYTGQGILTRFIERLVAMGYAVCVENMHSPRF